MKHALLTLALLGLFSLPADACLRRASRACTVQRVTTETTVIRQRVRMRQPLRRAASGVRSTVCRGCR